MSKIRIFMLICIRTCKKIKHTDQLFLHSIVCGITYYNSRIIYNILFDVLKMYKKKSCPAKYAFFSLTFHEEELKNDIKITSLLYFEQLTESGPLYCCLVYVLIPHWCNAGIHWIRCTLSLWDQFVQINVFILFPDGSTCQHIYTWIQRLCQALSCSHDDSFSWPIHPIHPTLIANNPNPLPKLNCYPKV
jgi:hypothetical protein